MIFLTGGTGFLGSYILLELLEKGYSVKALKRTGSTLEQVRRVFNAFSSEPEKRLDQIQWVEGDILDVISLEECMKGCDTVVHAAGMVSFHRKDRRQLTLINVEGTANMVNVALGLGVPTFLYVSSIAAMGRAGDDEVITEKTVWKNSRLNSWYAMSKYSAEKEVWRGKEEGLDVLVVNPAIILGYGDAEQGSTQLFSTVHNGLGFFPVGSNGFVDVRDVSKAIGLLLSQDIRNEKYILSSGNITYLQLFSILAAALGKKPPSVRINSFMAGAYWRYESFKSMFTGKKPLVTRETALTAMNVYQYDGSRITRQLDFTYTPFPETIHLLADQLKKDFNW